MKTQYIALLAIMILSFGCTQMSSYKNDNYGISFDYPSNWAINFREDKVDVDGMPPSPLVYVKGRRVSPLVEFRTDSMATSVTVSIKKIGDDRIEDYLDSVYEYPSVVILASGKKIIGDREVFFREGAFPISPAFKQYILETSKFKQYYLKHGDLLLEFSVSAFQESYNRTVSDTEEILLKLRLY